MGEGCHFLPDLPKLNTPSSPNPSIRDATTDSLEIAFVGRLTPCGLAHATNWSFSVSAFRFTLRPWVSPGAHKERWAPSKPGTQQDPRAVPRCLLWPTGPDQLFINLYLQSRLFSRTRCVVFPTQPTPSGPVLWVELTKSGQTELGEGPQPALC